MKTIFKLRWILITVWVAALVALVLTAPDMGQLVRDKANYDLPDEYSSSVAADLQKELEGADSGDTYIAVFHRDQPLTEKNMSAIENTMNRVRDQQDRLHITGITDSFENGDLEKRLLSENKHTLIAMLRIDQVKGQTTGDLRKPIDREIQTDGIETYLTGSPLIVDDMSQAAQDGLHKTEGITVIFILVVLVLVFRSAIAPFVPLVTVGASYVAAQAVVSFMVRYFNFPVSNFTQIFMVVVMFGIGTDYCILLMSRFKEELAATGYDKRQATMNTFRTAGKTVLQSGTPVFIAFMALSFVQFSVYKSAVAVGVGIIFLLLAIFTLLPVFMISLGSKLFWPMNSRIRQSKSRIWASAGHLAFTRPIIALLIIGIFTIPPIIAYGGQLSFNSPEDIPDKYMSKQGFNVVSKDFGPGNISPTTIYLKNDDNMRTTDYVALMEKISADLSTVPHVDSVLSVSRPLGDRLNDIYVNNQADKMKNGLNRASSGLGTIGHDLNDASRQIDASQPKLDSAISDVDRLQSGTQQTADGVGRMQDALKQITDGIHSGSAGTAEIRNHVAAARGQLKELQSGEAQIQQGYQEIAANLEKISDQLNQFSSAGQTHPAIDTSQLEKLMGSIQTTMKTLNDQDIPGYMATHTDWKQDPAFLKILSDLQQLEKLNQLPATLQDIEKEAQSQILQQTKNAETQINELNHGIRQLADAMNRLNAESEKVSGGLDQFHKGLSQLDTGLSQLESGLNRAGDGQDQVIAGIPQVTGALDQIASGQDQIKAGFGQVRGQMGTLSDGLSQGSEGAGKIRNGINSANQVVTDWSKLSYSQSGIYVPQSIFDNSDFNKSLDTYISEDGKVASIQVISTLDPYANQSFGYFNELKDEISSSLKGTKLENAKIGIGGVASGNADTQQMSEEDYTRVVIFVLIGVFMALVVVLRSLTMPLYLMASLLLTYFASLGFGELIFTKIFDYSGLSWVAPFFTFIVLMALGIDYSIFLMTRFNEYAQRSIRERMLLTLWHMGGVIFSAVIILGGTFAAMLPSGMLSLIEIASIVVIGLLLYAFIVLPLFVPVMVKLFGRGNWWPFYSGRSEKMLHSDTHSVTSDN
ncbi:MMPL family transporter [Sporolactobacillus sp. THM19-2]|uniref:MMPL family transporter n=1 Tax=Sporolactobacillus sp. THM19-2 TaxID=2511171 RepID=UPI00101FD0DD|nr:MMPL family transporter [Sporolactobacillus sp. THM19-2]RYL94091.1 MMPL family transporter [Sporolactobacillus sp. THM19-2]